jgi:hypothetical protein
MTSDRPLLRITEWHPLHKYTVRGFTTVELPNGLIVRNVSVHSKGGSPCASLPARPMLVRNGIAVRIDVGKTKDSAVLQWRGRDITDRFSAAVVITALDGEERPL